MTRIHHTKNKGDLGCLKVQTRMCEMGFTILIPLTEHESFDFVAYKDGKFLRVQAKYRTLLSDGHIEIPLRNSWADKKGTHAKYIDKTAIDLIGTYCPNTDKVYFVNPNNFSNKSAIALRVTPTKNNQNIRIKFADDYLQIIL